MSEAPRQRARRAHHPATALVLLALAVAAVTSLGIAAHATYGARVTADEPQYLLSALSLGHDGDLDIANQLEGEAYRPFHRVDLDAQTYVLDGSGRQVSPHDPLLPVVLATPVRLGGWAAGKAVIALSAGGLAALTAWVAMRRFGVAARPAIGTVAAFACTAPLATYATQVYPEVPAALTVMAAVAVLSGPLPAPSHRVVLFGTCLVALPWWSVKYVPVAAVLAGMGWWRVRRQRGPATGLVVGLVVMAALYAGAHRWLYGGWTAYASGDHFAAAGGEQAVIGTSPNYAGRARRLSGLLVDRRFGLVPWMPAWLLLPPAVCHLSRRRPPGWALLVAPLAAGWLVATFVALTMHGWWWPGRQLVVVLPLGVVAVAVAVERLRAVRLALGVGAAAGAVTWVWSTVDAIARRRVLVVDFDRTANPAVRVWQPLLPDGQSAGAADDWRLAAASAVVAALAVWGWRAAGRRPTPPL